MKKLSIEQLSLFYEVRPFIKWVGGKRQLMQEIKSAMPSSFDTYYEPFVGGGAVLFSLQPEKAVINDYNEELVTAYKTIRDNVEELIEHLKHHENESDYFYNLRAIDREEDFIYLSDVEKTSRFIYLNKTCYNGLYRVNQKGYFNTPFGKYKNPDFVNEQVLRGVSQYLNQNDIKIKSGDFEEAVQTAKKGDFVYFDPPYDPLNETSAFTSYTENGFNENEQIRLKLLCNQLDQKDVKFMLSNSNTEFIRDLYSDYSIQIVNAKRSINSVGHKRGNVEEVLVTNYDRT